jgi:hypothetical protein
MPSPPEKTRAKASLPAGGALAERPGLPALQERQALRDQENWSVSLRQQEMPQRLYGHDRDRNGAAGSSNAARRSLKLLNLLRHIEVRIQPA